MLYPAKHFVALCLLQTAMIRAFCSAPGARRVMRLPKLKHATPLSHEFNSQLRSRQYLSGGITATVETSMSPRHPDSQLFSENQQQDSQGSIHHDFQRGDQVQVEIVSFGPLGASVDVVGLGHDTEPITLDQEPYGYGLIIQEEISYFRQGRGNVDVVTGEIIPAYVQHIRYVLPLVAILYQSFPTNTIHFLTMTCHLFFFIKTGRRKTQYRST